MACVSADESSRPDALILLLHRSVWQPARYAHPDWFALLGFHRNQRWRYGESPVLDSALNRALRARRGGICLPGRLNERQRRLAMLAPNMPKYALALGLLTLACGDYFLLPDYRHALRRWLDNDLIWHLFGMCDNKRPALFSPEQVIDAANRIGIAMLYRAAREEPVLQALLIQLPPLRQALYPVTSLTTMNLLERMLCRCADSR
ncbi:type III secretion system domain-containing protein [Candidatus Symbiopectobacterium sp. NZEC151]|uniref:type III secretion system domain-containing protein n=2 Tax=unclassified Symbiopectobacterium TaxID=2794573 RepID=UPI0022279FA0|nr:type III secretion system domain-containing protein [Candidatus Symbiopectobacterium sp. NZEC151]MCW2474989.1 type III secretion protein [Candidatus Symbiopectobacterium sp. NZEC151]